MISLLNGTVRSLLSDRVIIEVQGVGYAVLVTSATSASLTLGAQAIVHTSLVVREDSLTLFGFLDEESKNTFELLQTVSGVGPKVALSILGSLSIEDLGRAIAQENVAAIEKVPGIG
jgi:Holliday junction DNA helicase RuvA